MEPSEYEALAALEESHWWYVGMAAISQQLIQRRVDPPARLLDAGCGTGGALLWLSKFGRGVGCDFSPLALQYARRKTTAPLVRADVQALPYRSESFGLVTNFDVLYHLGVMRDEAAVAEFFRVLQPGGWLCLRVPAHERLRRRHDRQVHTRHRYAAAELRRKLEAAGFVSIHLSQAGTFVLLAALMTALLESLRPGAAEKGSALTLPQGIVNRFLLHLLRAEAPLVEKGRVPFGLSMYALGQKPLRAVAT